jgi:hypothetical protein
MPLWSALVVSLLAVQPYDAEVDHPVPIEGHGRHGDVSSYGFFIKKGNPDEEAAQLAAIRERLGDETVDRIQRSRERMRHPRPLTATEREVIRKAMAPVLWDLEASGAIVPEILYETRGDERRQGSREGVATEVTPGGHGGSVWVPTEECSPAEQVWWAADQLQDWEVHQLWHAGRSTTWPECRDHPNSHPLEPGIYGDDTAVWRCPMSKHISCAIGELGSGE